MKTRIISKTINKNNTRMNHGDNYNEVQQYQQSDIITNLFTIFNNINNTYVLRHRNRFIHL